jgi:hypothetical protein
VGGLVGGFVILAVGLFLYLRRNRAQPYVTSVPNPEMQQTSDSDLYGDTPTPAVEEIPAAPASESTRLKYTPTNTESWETGGRVGGYG